MGDTQLSCVVAVVCGGDSGRRKLRMLLRMEDPRRDDSGLMIEDEREMGGEGALRGCVYSSGRRDTASGETSADVSSG